MIPLVLVGGSMFNAQSKVNALPCHVGHRNGKAGQHRQRPQGIEVARFA